MGAPVPVTDLGDDLESVDHDPFSGTNQELRASGPDQGFSGHVYATPEANQPLSAGYLAAHSPSLTQGDPDVGRWLGEKVFGWGQALGASPEHAQGLGNLAQFGYGFTPMASGESAYNAAWRGDMPGTFLGMAGVLPIPGAAPEASGLGAVARDFPSMLRAAGMHEATPVISQTGDILHGMKTLKGNIPYEYVGGPMAMLGDDGTLKQGILAYHGSPHTFGQFDISKIGTGEGGAAYGKGLYFAEHPETAGSYRPSFEDVFKDPEGKQVKTWSGLENYQNDAMRALINYKSFDKARNYFENSKVWQAGTDPTAIDYYNKALGAVDELEKQGYHVGPAGSKYRTFLNVDPNQLLDLDQTIGNQPHLHDALHDARIEMPRLGKEGIARLQDMAQFGSPAEQEFAGHQLAYIQRVLSNRGFEYKPDTISQMEKMRDAGIPGIKFLDQRSRPSAATQQFIDMWGGNREKALRDAQRMLAQAMQHTPESFAPNEFFNEAALEGERNYWRNTVHDLTKPQTRNYVLFDDKTIDILKRYGMGGLGGAGLADAIANAHQNGEDPTVSEGQFRAEGGRVGFANGGSPWDDVAGSETGEPIGLGRQTSITAVDSLGGRSGGAGGVEGLRPASGEASAPGDPLSDEEARAAAAAGPYRPVSGLPQKGFILPGGIPYIPGPLAKIHDAAYGYMQASGLPYDPPTDYGKLDRDRAVRIAQAYDAMQHAPNDPQVRAAYEALARETMAQWQHVKATGLKVDWITPETGDPYAANPRMAIKDIRDNNHWWGFPTDLGYGSTGEDIAQAENPLLRFSGETVGGRPARYNDIFRIVHDYFGHAKEGHGFRAEGEENAWRSHMAMYSPPARAAATSELRGQNSWLNFGPHGEANRTAKAADTVFADQKIGLMPSWTWWEGAGGGAGMGMPHVATRPQSGDLMSEAQYLQRLREGIPTPGEWTGGRIGYADGGSLDDLEPVDFDPFARPAVRTARALANQGIRTTGSSLEGAPRLGPIARGRMGYQGGGDIDPDQTRITGHIVATPESGQMLTPKYLAAKPHMTPAQAQAASWIGGGHITGLGSDAAKDFMKFLEDRVANTAAKTGQTPENVLSNVIRGRHPLLSIAPLAAAPIAADAFSRSQQQGTNPPGGDR
jgi:hypothetical protein